MERKAYITVAVLVVFGLLIISAVPRTVEPRLSKVNYNESKNPITWVGPEESLRANFSDHFYVIVNRNFDRIRLWISPAEGVRITHIQVSIKREISNELYLEIEPPWYGRVEIHNERAESGAEYTVEVKDLGEAGEGMCELTFVDRAPEERLPMHIYVEAKGRIFSYRGELSVVILKPYYSPDPA